MYIKFMTYLHLNGLHGEVKYYKYLMDEMDFENQVADDIRRYCEIILKPIVLNRHFKLNTNIFAKIVKSINCKNRLLNPYVKEIQFALEYFFDSDELSTNIRKNFKKMLSLNYGNFQIMNDFFVTNGYYIPDYEYEDIFDIILVDYNNLLNLL